MWQQLEVAWQAVQAPECTDQQHHRAVWVAGLLSQHHRPLRAQRPPAYWAFAAHRQEQVRDGKVVCAMTTPGLDGERFHWEPPGGGAVPIMFMAPPLWAGPC